MREKRRRSALDDDGGSDVGLGGSTSDVDSGVGGAPPAGPSRYSAKALQIARIALVHHSNGRPIKKSVLREETGIDGLNEFARQLRLAQQYLQSELGLLLTELAPVPVGGGKMSPARGEFVLLSAVSTHRHLFAAALGAEQRHELGVLCFVLVLLVLGQKPLSLAEIARAQADALGDVPGNLEEAACEELRPVLAALADQRFLEHVRGTATATAAGGIVHNDVDGALDNSSSGVYVIGPATKATIMRKELRSIILRAVFPRESVLSEEFQEEKKMYIRDLENKLDSVGV